MTELHELPWDPLSPSEVIALFDNWDRFWCIAGGWALDLWLGRTTREHEDMDVQMLRDDIEALPDYLNGWDFHIAETSRSLPRWQPGTAFPSTAHNLWCRPTDSIRWRLQVLVMDHSADRWIFRRNRTIGGSLASLRIVIDRIPIIAPEVQLLYKGTSTVRLKDEVDFSAVQPTLTLAQRAWLRAALAARQPDHPWLTALEP